LLILGSSIIPVSIVSVGAVIHDSTIVHESTSHVQEVFLPPRYNTEMSPVERRKTARIKMIKTFKILFLVPITKDNE
jgi:hypothetical protein